jgi:hypothetical protein
LNGSGTCSGLSSIVPNSGHSEVVSDVAFFSVEHFTQCLLQLVAHRLPQVEEVVGGDIDLRFPGWQRWQVDGINICVSRQHQLQLEPFDLLHTGLGVARGR